MTATSQQHVSHRLGNATVRSRVSVPLRFPGGVLLNHPTLATDPIVEQAGRGLLGLGLTVSRF